MPTKIGKDADGRCWARWGTLGEKHYYACDNREAEEGARAKAAAQGAAIHASSAAGSLVLQLQTFPAVIIFDRELKGSGGRMTRYRKELIKVGKYVKEATDQFFEVSIETLDHWVKEFRRWTTNGNRVPIPLGHDRASEPEANQGWVLNMFREGKILIGILELLNPELALTTDVSIAVPKEAVDGSGIRYTHPITHVALTTQPVVTGLKDFEKLSLSLISNLNPMKGDNTMALELAKLAALLGVEESELTEDAIIAALDPKKVVVGQPAPAAPAVAASRDTGIAASATVVDPLLAKVVGENRSAKLDTLLRAGLVTPAIKDVITARYIEEKALTLSLSKGADDGFDLLMQVLTENKPVSLGEASGPQLLEMSNVRAKSTQSVMQADITRRRKAAGLKD